MKKIVMLLLLMIYLLSAQVYQVGDTVSDIAFTDTNLNSGQLSYYDRSVYNLINQKKLLVVNFFSPG